YKLLEHPRLRAAYDFLLLRCASGEIDAEIGEWWTNFMAADGNERELLLATKPRAAVAGAKKRSTSRGGRGRKKVTGSTESPE
ncbi:MAG: polynucleotide adenylyltransferase PcnB, partial [Oxalobacteraceae bacterium]